MGHHTGCSGSGKTKLLNVIKQKNEDDYNISVKICLYFKDRNEAKYQYLIRKHEKKLVLKSMKIERLLMNSQIIFWMSIKITKNITQIKNVKY